MDMNNFNLSITIECKDPARIPQLLQQYTNFLANISRVADKITIIDNTLDNAAPTTIWKGVATPVIQK